ncbi:MAG TPA: hypothetical protein VNT01_17660 [Symbiobacteriaceae bacterium]|nr:hypothetical protein [Symbiobacteriaceae bacterium]
MTAENRPAQPDDGSVEIRTPAKFYATADALSKAAGIVPPMSGGQNPGEETCPFTAHQIICASGEVTTTVTPSECVTTVRCLNGGVGTACPPGTPQPCSFKFFQNLCVQVDVSFTANAVCRLNDVQCLGVDTGPCPEP